MKILRSYIYRAYLTKIQIFKMEELYYKNVLLFNMLIEEKKKLLDLGIKNEINIKEFINGKEEFANGNLNSYLYTNKLIELLFRKNSDYLNIQNKKIDIYPKKIHFSFYKNMIPIFKENSVFIPKIGFFKIKYHRKLPDNCEFISLIVEERIKGEYYLNFSISYLKNVNVILPKNAIGIDYSSPHFFCSSENILGDCYIVRNYNEAKISGIKKRLKRCVKDGSNYKKLKLKEQKLYQDVKNKRRYYLNKAANDFLKHFDVVGVETLSMREIGSKKNLGKHTYENSYKTFLDILKYKSKEQGKYVINVPKYFPSSKICSNCGQIHYDMTLNDRIINCDCGAKLDRDLNAAINIKNEAVCILNRKFKTKKYKNIM